MKRFTNPSRTLLATSKGHLVNLGNGNGLMGYGGLPDCTEHDSSGQVLCDAAPAPNVQNFRTYLARDPPSRQLGDNAPR